ncbi:Endonuclease/exonuclease/phosphatase [Fimicolochytrium jonesii]|uniref:Endonuclease/exonuclease/phosphatase n=1 Tax=Fimicolochytrium jonesii TaxID=1396493 RepID=UPI0022FEA93E|nr:Endonuclease/exonuclease/phosphatase [Fimicolochytrium jonesii]KAI8825151.1 Endonuclease/exonuclease/phosphatase [Fimicolochytrium jonesii]
MDSVLSSRQSASPHHHARVAAAAARSALSNPDAATNGANGNSSGGAGVDPNAKPSAWTILDLGGMQLKNLSASLFNYTFLTTLYLNHNALGLLSQEVAKLTSLVVLDLSGNRLTSLPSELGMLLSLKELLLHDNELTFLPPELGQLYQLDNLGLEGNPLNEPISSMIQKEGTSAVVTYLREMCPVGPPPPDREWISLEEDYAGDTKDTFTVMCYNILCEKYATPAMYAYTPSWALNWEYRRDLLLQDILNYNADIVLLQEMQMDQYEDFFRDQLSQIGGYEGVFYPKSRARTMAEYDRRQVDGCATFWKANKFSLLEKHCIEFQQTAMRKPELRKTDDVFNRVMIKDNVATVALLENKESKAKLLVSNAHLHWDPVYKDVKLVQTGMLMEEIETLCKSWGRTHGGASSTATKGGKSLMSSSPTSATSPTADSTRFPVLICGDFNSLPDSGVYEYLSGGRVDKDHSDFSHYVYGPYTSEGLSHHFSLKSAYSHLNTAACPGGELEFTNFAPGFKGTIDYVFYSTNSLEVTGLLSCVDKEYISRVVGLPNAHHPSDHLPLVVSLRAKPAVGANNGNSSSSVNQAAVAAAFANAGNASGGGGGKRIQ